MKNQDKILVVGATGFLGMEIVRLLIENGNDVRAMVRSSSAPEKVAALKSLGAELVTGDLRDSASLRAACDGVTTVISTATASTSRQPTDTLQSVDHDGQLALVDSAVEKRVLRFVFVSFPRMSLDNPFQQAKIAVEQRLLHSGLTYTILQPTFFSEVWLSPALGFDIAGGTSRVFGSGDHRVRWISLHDVARFAVAATQNAAFDDAIVPLGGPDPLSQLEVLAVFADLGVKLQPIHIPLPVLEAQFHAAPDPVSKSLTAVAVLLARGDLVEIQAPLDLLPGRLTTVRDYAIAVAGSGAHEKHQ
jgi:NADH dehydrogenase